MTYTDVRQEKQMPEPVLCLKDRNFKKVKLALSVNSDLGLATALNVNRSTIADVKAGHTQPSGQFLAALLYQSGMNFDEIFEVKSRRSRAA